MAFHDSWKNRARRGSPDPAETADRQVSLPGLFLDRRLRCVRGRETSAVNIFALGAGLPTPPGSDRDCRGNAMGETCGRAFRRGRETRAEPHEPPCNEL